MRFRIPGKDVHVRFAERVATGDDQYVVIDFGLEHAEGGVDSIAVGGSFHTARQWANKQDSQSLKKAKKKAKKAAKKAAVDNPPTPENVVAAAF